MVGCKKHMQEGSSMVENKKPKEEEKERRKEEKMIDRLPGENHQPPT